jgi:hypothetical protein
VRGTAPPWFCFRFGPIPPAPVRRGGSQRLLFGDDVAKWSAEERRLFDVLLTAKRDGPL